MLERKMERKRERERSDSIDKWIYCRAGTIEPVSEAGCVHYGMLLLLSNSVPQKLLSIFRLVPPRL